MNESFFHIINRGVEKRKIFLNNEDYFRFVHNLSDFNDKNIMLMSYNDRRRYLAMRKPNDKNKANEAVDVLCWCLMPNHYHVLVQEKIDGGVSLFSKKISSGYTQYFNLKNERSGVLFQGRSKIISIENEPHFIHLPYYIFSNSLNLIEKGWKETGVKNAEKAIDFIENYKWSSYQDIIGKKNFPFVVNKKLFFEIFDTNEKRFKKDFKEWLFGYRIDGW